MSSDEIRHLMEFILKQQAIFSSEMIELKSRLDQMGLGHQEQNDALQRQSEVVQRQGENIERLAAAIERQAEAAKQQSADIRNLAIAAQQQAESIESVGAFVRHVAETMEVRFLHLTESAEINRQEMRHATENLISGNEATRELANRAAQLAIQVSQRLSAHEREPHEA